MAANQRSSLKYQPLDAKRLEIRILKIAPSDRDGEVQCSLVVTSLLDYPEYHALSYCWGEAPADHNVLIDGEVFVVTSSLETALRELRRCQVGSIWVDFVRIPSGRRSSRTIS